MIRKYYLNLSYRLYKTRHKTTVIKERMKEAGSQL